MISGLSWDDERFVERCRKAAARRGWSLSKLCLKAGLANDYLAHAPIYGRNISSIIKLANAAGVSVAWLLGLDEASEDLARIGLVANLTAHWFVALHPTARGTPDSDDVALILMDLLKRRQPSADEAEPPPAAGSVEEASPPRRDSRTSRARSSARQSSEPVLD